jgi:transglutaminase-like putative cysteine protease
MLEYAFRRIARLRPPEGWARFWWTLALIGCIHGLGSSAQLTLPASSMTLAALLALLCGRLLGRRSPQSASKLKHWLVWLVTWTVLLLGTGFWLLQNGSVFPPANLLERDLNQLVSYVWPQASPEPLPSDEPSIIPSEASTPWDSIAYMQSSLPRFWSQLLNAPYAGQSGARLIASSICMALAWIGFFLLGLAHSQGRNLALWTLPSMALLVVMKLMGNGDGMWFLFGIGIALLLALLDSAGQREAFWQRKGLDYASDLRIDAVVYGVLVLAVTLSLSALLPFSLDNRVSRWIWSQFEPPSGLAELEKQIQTNQQGPNAQQIAQIAGSSLPNVLLGYSLEEDDPNKVALQIHVNQAIPEGPTPNYWRSRILTSYTSRSWEAEATLTTERPLDLPAGIEVDLIIQDITDFNPRRRVLYGLPQIVGVNIPAFSERHSDGSLLAITADERPGNYRVFSRHAEGTLVTTRPDEQPDFTPYLQLPGNLPPRVLDLARTITRDARTHEEIGLALERYLRELPYTYEVAPLSTNRDAVDQFLFEMRQGYCTYYASSFAVMARSLGVPARLAVGYSTGDYDPASQTFTVLEGNAHAWPELYIAGRWVAFEPTPIMPLPARNSQPQRPLPQVIEAVPESNPLSATKLADYWPGLLLILGILVAVSAPWWPRLRPDYSPNAILRQFEQRGRKIGVVWPEGATMSEYANMLNPRTFQATRSLSTLVELLETARYSQHKLSREQQSRLLNAWTVVRDQVLQTKK